MWLVTINIFVFNKENYNLIYVIFSLFKDYKMCLQCY